MLSLSDPAARPTKAERAATARYLGLNAIWIVALAIGGAIGAGPPGPAMEPALRHLLELMALLKTAVAIGAVLLVEWRLAVATRRVLIFGYSGAVALMAAGSAMLWHMAHLLAAGVLFHAGLLLFLAFAYADRDAPAAMLSHLQAKRARWKRGYL